MSWRVNVSKKATAVKVITLILAIVLIIAGIYDGGYNDVKNKAIRICYECIGIG